MIEGLNKEDFLNRNACDSSGKLDDKRCPDLVRSITGADGASTLQCKIALSNPFVSEGNKAYNLREIIFKRMLMNFNFLERT
jgi:hypothetical protein